MSPKGSGKMDKENGKAMTSRLCVLAAIVVALIGGTGTVAAKEAPKADLKGTDKTEADKDQSDKSNSLPKKVKEVVESVAEGLGEKVEKIGEVLSFHRKDKLVQNEKPSPFYLEFELGIASPRISMNNVGTIVDQSDFKDDDYIRVLGGYVLSTMPTSRFSMELFYADYGLSEGDNVGNGASILFNGQSFTPTSTIYHSVELQSLGLGFNLKENLSKKFSINMSVGMHYWTAETSSLQTQTALGVVNGSVQLLTTSPTVTEEKATKGSSYISVGAGYAITRNIAVNFTHTRYKFQALSDNGYYKSYAMGMSYKFD